MNRGIIAIDKNTNRTLQCQYTMRRYIGTFAIQGDHSRLKIED